VTRAAYRDAVQALPLEQLWAVQLAHEQDLVHEGLQELEQHLHQRVRGHAREVEARAAAAAARSRQWLCQE
jgi:D-serine deaminase-like pyridoxal phosphate-dependent protein